MINYSEVRAELIRKALHVLIALVPFLASFNSSNTALLLLGGVFLYITAESLRYLGFTLPLISPLTEAVLRRRELGHFALGPVTLGLGALLALILFPLKEASVAIYALAFGDSAATLAGKFLGRVRPPFMAGKSLEGSLACFAASALVGFLVTGDWKKALAIGLAATLAETLPFRDFDNLILPLAAGLAAYFC